MKMENPPVTRRGFVGVVLGWAGAILAARVLPGCASRYEAVGPELVASGGESVLELTRTAYPGAYDIHWEPVRGSIQIDQIRGYDRGPYQYMVDDEVIGDGDARDARNTYSVDQYRLRAGQRLQWMRVVA